MAEATPDPVRVWAPRADRVDLVDLTDPDAGPVDHPMTAAGGGWWTVDPPAGLQDYGFRLDGDGTVRPDPRSRWQPAGVDGPTRRFDPDEYEWGDGAWTGRRLAGSIIYELHVGTFTPEGTLDAAAGKLDHLLSIGVDMVELLPVNAFAGTHNWGYDGVLWYAVQDSYGGPRAYQRFVDACHRRGIGVIQDVVYNHLGAGGNHIPLFGPYLNPTAGGSPWGDSINLDGPDSGEVRRYIVDNVVMWLRDYHVDGLRLDAVHALNDSHATHLLEDIAKRVDALAPHVRRPLSLIAESDLNDPKLITPREAGGYGLTAQWNDDFHHVLHVALTGETEGYYADFGRMSDIAKVLTRGFFHDGTFSSFRGRDHGRPVDTLTTPAWRFLGYAQNHDQVGNRAAGDRLTATLSADRLAIAAVLVLTAPFTPMLFMGEEWAASTPWQFFTSHTDQFLADATRQGRVEEFARMGWDQDLVPDPQARSTFENSKLDWSEPAGGDHERILRLYRELAALRRARAELTDPWFGTVDAAFDDDERWLLIDRSGLRIAVNLADEPRTVPLGGPAGPVLLTTGPGVRVDGERLVLPPTTAVVLGPAG